ncbi:uncharacterized protein VP01_2721g4 [Puccinia sorghi]|uniref:Uncharacterized protein n=1 Tax=Puccinia sorghi TaxID=27349 RepID=A0A0L6V3F8_9BASI|nr:uncharacterized protein VP01_2721g4 [Puccinia sorghi]
MDDDTKISVPLLTAENFIEWNFKMKKILRGKGLYDLVIGLKFHKEAGQYVSAAFFQDLKNKALGTIAPRIHKSLISTVSANGGEDDLVVLWSNILALCSLKKGAGKPTFQVRGMKSRGVFLWGGVGRNWWLQSGGGQFPREGQRDGIGDFRQRRGGEREKENWCGGEGGIFLAQWKCRGQKWWERRTWKLGVGRGNKSGGWG